MRRVSRLLVGAAFCAGIVACTHKTTVSSGETTVTSDDANKSVTVTSKDGTATVGKDAVDLAKLGVPVYPGAQQNEGGINVAASSGNMQMVTLSTTDAFDKVYDWYKAQLPKDAEKMKVSSSADDSMAQFQTDGPDSGKISITISGKKDKTSVVILKGDK
jgi:acyl-CoA synthetase (AMP-forming)/AMP-acid ligase II